MSEAGALAPTDAVIVRRTPVGESDLIVALFTREYGRVSAVARGARRSRRRFPAGLEMLAVLSVTLGRRRRGSELYGLEEAELIDDHRALALDPIALGHASYALELVRELAPPEAPDPGLLDCVVALWRALAAGPAPALLRAFELAVCAELGSAVVLDACAACGADVLGVGAVFDPARGGAVCGACAARSTGLGVRPLDEDVRAYLRAVAAGPIAAARAIEVAPDVRIGARDAMLAVVTHLVGHPLTTLEFVTQVHGGLGGR